MTTIAVRTAGELQAALKAAKGGETILLAEGDYGSLTMGKWSPIEARYASEVTVASADPDKPAKITEMLLREVSNVTFDGINFDYTFKAGQPTWHAAFKVHDSEGVTIRNSVFDGDVASGMGGADDGFATGQGLAIWGQDLTVENNEFREFWTALGVGGKDVTVRGNDIHSIRSDGMRVVNVQGVVIEDNHIHDFKGSYASGDHRDMIQFWTTNLKTPNTDIVIRGNRLDIGEGSEAQSIFMRNEAVDSQNGGDAMFYRNVLIEQNVITNAHLHGISVGETHGLTIRDNTVLQRTGDREFDKGDGVRIPTINVAKDSTGVVITGNISGNSPTAQTGWVVSGNVQVQDNNPGKANHYNEVFVDSSLATGQDPILRPGGLADLAGAGADASAPGRAHDAASFNIHLVDGDAMGRIFDAAQGRSAAELAGTRFEWTFEDGTTVGGPVAMKSFGALGENRVTLTEWRPDGTSSKVALDLMIEPRTILEIGEGGRLETLSGAEREVVDVTHYAEGGGIDLGAKGSTALLGRGDVDRLYKADKFEIAMTLSADSRQCITGRSSSCRAASASRWARTVGSTWTSPPARAGPSSPPPRRSSSRWTSRATWWCPTTARPARSASWSTARRSAWGRSAAHWALAITTARPSSPSATNGAARTSTRRCRRSGSRSTRETWTPTTARSRRRRRRARRVPSRRPRPRPRHPRRSPGPNPSPQPQPEAPPQPKPQPEPEPEPEPEQQPVPEAPRPPAAGERTLLQLMPDGTLKAMPGGAEVKNVAIKYAASDGGLDLGAKGSHVWLGRSDVDRLYTADKFEIAMTLEADVVGASGKLLELQGGFSLGVNSPRAASNSAWRPAAPSGSR